MTQIKTITPGVKIPKNPWQVMTIVSCHYLPWLLGHYETNITIIYVVKMPRESRQLQLLPQRHAANVNTTLQMGFKFELVISDTLLGVACCRTARRLKNK